jgi:3-dehydroquinate dehydratase-1
MSKIAHLDLNERSRIVIALRDGVDLQEVTTAMDAGADMIELRVDQFSSSTREAVLGEISRYQDIPILATIRCGWEGGAWKGTEAQRLALYRDILPHVDAIDIELSAEEIVVDVIQAAREAGKVVLGSFHNFETTPSLAQLSAILNDGKQKGVDIIKVAAFCDSSLDLCTLTHFTAQHADENLVTIGMGPYGKGSRIFFPLLGSLLTYTFLGTPTAPGQLNLEDTLKYLGVFCPKTKHE